MNPNKKNTFFGLLRHAPTVWNMQKKVQGHQDSPLTARGQEMALAWGKKLRQRNWDRILCSDLGRTRHTAELMNQSLHLPVSTDSRLREKDWGQWTSRKISQIRKSSPELLADMEQSGWAFRPPGGENREEVWERGRQALTDASLRWPGAEILLITHEGLIKCLIYRLSSRNFLPDDPPLLRPFHVHELCCDGFHVQIHKINAINLGIS
ncbi:MAG: histidine phosphatase family protein [Desulfococcaceae bacterium]|nr:histidine phosphatase family protein [Desulfococcaceae bacterium]